MDADPPLQPAAALPRSAPARQPSGRGRPYAPETVAAIRALVETTPLPMRAIAARVGVSRTTVTALRARHGWARPRAARVSLRGQRGGGHPILPEVVEAARALIEGTALSTLAIARRTGVARNTLCRWRKQRGWRRPEEAPAFLPGPRADGRARPTRFRTLRGMPYTADAVGETRMLLARTVLSQKAIAKRLGVSQWWVGDQLRRSGLSRPPAPCKRGFAAPRRSPLSETGAGVPTRPRSSRRRATITWRANCRSRASGGWSASTG